MRETNQVYKQQCLKSYWARDRVCKKEEELKKRFGGSIVVKPKAKTFDFSSTPCKNFGLNLYDC